MKNKLFTKILFCFLLTASSLIAMALFVANTLNSDFIDKMYQEVDSVLHTNTDNFLISHSATTLSYLEEELMNDIYFSDIDSMRTKLHKFANDSSIDSITVWDHASNPLVEHNKANIPLSPNLNAELTSSLLITKEALIDNNDKIILARNLYFDDEKIGCIIIVTNRHFYDGEIKHSLDIIQQMAQRHEIEFHQRYMVIILLPLLIFIVLISSIISRIIKPLKQLSMDVTRFGDNSQEIRILSYKTNDEIGELAKNFHQMIEKVRRREAEITQLAEHDALTGLYNRHHLISTANALIKSNEINNLLCIYMDLDNFKEINDTFGHYEGDKLIIEIANRLQKLRSEQYYDSPLLTQCFKNNLTLSRLGGDEFVLLFHFDEFTPYSDGALQAIINTVQTIFSARFLNFTTAASIGVSLYPRDGNNIDELLRNADIAMYSAKEHGKGKHKVFSKEMSEALLREQWIEHALSGALSAKEQPHISLVYQPQYCISTMKLTGVEALVRWQHPEFGFISPAEFIPIAEQRGLIKQLTILTIDKMIQDILLWRIDNSNDISISWNLSAIVLLKADITSLLKEKLQSINYNTECLKIEITETALINDRLLAKKKIDELRQAGFQIWLDDFGTGYSSLSILNDVDIDGLKIDRSFVNQISGKESTSVVDAFIQLAKALKLDVVAEGIETEEQLHYLQLRTCMYAQGYYLARPQSLKEVGQLMKRECIEHA